MKIKVKNPGKKNDRYTAPKKMRFFINYYI